MYHIPDRHTKSVLLRTDRSIRKFDIIFIGEQYLLTYMTCRTYVCKVVRCCVDRILVVPE